jgi:hypothetical protein
VAYDEYIPFKVSKGKVLVNDEESELSGKKIRVEFIKVIHWLIDFNTWLTFLL